jgi:hypothetical protein
MNCSFKNNYITLKLYSLMINTSYKSYQCRTLINISAIYFAVIYKTRLLLPLITFSWNYERLAPLRYEHLTPVSHECLTPLRYERLTKLSY